MDDVVGSVAGMKEEGDAADERRVDRWGILGSPHVHHPAVGHRVSRPLPA